ncbi:holo-ACP synthase [Flammeovirgaceae bacterium SG7u.111]|nr:holo-ACP synthase [Flammeovirgaceae bacterium SG7u.132]WPO36172.1 holo-ACP synthase [Flammeovirgaceae bacterium SG7u.111]
MILGIGVDIVETARIEKSIKKKGFVEKVFSEKEIAYCQEKARPHEHFAGRFAAKEALVKALGEAYYFQVEPSQVEVTNNEQGKPEFTVPTLPIFENLTIHLSISHCSCHAVAMVTIEKEV